MNKASVAESIISSGYGNCAQAILGGYAEELGLKYDVAMGLARGLGAGMGRTGGICGAVSAAILVIGLKVPGPADPRARRERVYSLVQNFIGEFTARHASTNCTDLLGFNLGAPAGQDEARRRDSCNRICPGLVFSAVTMLD